MAQFKPETVDIRLAITDNPPPFDGAVMMPCPRRDKHTDDTQSLAVYRGNVHCFGCDFHIVRRYESLAFVLGMWDGRGDGKAAAREAGKVAHLFVGRPVERAVQEPPPLNNSVALPYRIHLWGDRRDRLAHLLKWRGVSEVAADRFRVGYDVCGRYVLPVYDAAGNLITLRYRTDEGVAEEGQKKYSGMAGRNQTYLYPAWVLKERLDESSIDDLWVVEGELDTWPLWERGIPAVSVTNGANQVHRILEVITAALDRPISQVAKRIVIATDQDEPGNTAATQLSVACETVGIPWVRATWGNGKDITEFLREGGRMEEIYGQFQQNVGGSKGASQAKARPKRPRSLLRP